MSRVTRCGARQPRTRAHFRMAALSSPRNLPQSSTGDASRTLHTIEARTCIKNEWVTNSTYERVTNSAYEWATNSIHEWVTNSHTNTSWSPRNSPPPKMSYDSTSMSHKLHILTIHIRLGARLVMNRSRMYIYVNNYIHTYVYLCISTGGWIHWSSCMCVYAHFHIYVYTCMYI